jgi:outer membrane protein assembly factor BamB
VILQCDTQADSFVVALDATTGRQVWKTERVEQPSWGSPTVVETRGGPQLVTNASKRARAYDPRTGQELWRLGPTSNITAPTPIGADNLIVLASGRRPEAPIFVVRAGARGEIAIAGEQESPHLAWSRRARGPYMPTPLIYRGRLYVLANNGVFDAYDLATGEEVYRARVEPVGSGFSASPVAADGRIYLSGEDGDMFVVDAGAKFGTRAINPMGELLMATPALSDGVMYVRSASSLFAIGHR